jgi:HK97 family phage portal protein
MNLFSPILRLFNSRSLSNPDTGYQIGALERTTTESGVTVSDERALKVSAVWACVQLISNSVASMPISVFRDTDSGRSPLNSKHYLTDLLHKRPNQYMKPRDFRLAMTVQMALWNNAYAEIGYSGDRPTSITPLRPGRMAPHIDKDGRLTYHYHIKSSAETGVKVYDPRSILHLKGFGTDGIVGVERNNYAREVYGLAVAAETFAAKQFANGGRPGGVLTFDEFLKPDQREQARKLYEGLAEGPVNANRLWILEGGSKYEALDFTADQMQMIATRSQQLSEIARFFGVPGVMIGAGDNSNSAWPASFEQQMLSFLTFTLQSYLDEWECAIRDKFIPSTSDINVDHDVSGLIKMDSTSRGQYLATLVQNGLMTRNESRKVLNLPEIEGGDELTVQTNLSPLESLERATNANQEQSARPMPTQVRQ